MDKKSFSLEYVNRELYLIGNSMKAKNPKFLDNYLDLAKF